LLTAQECAHGQFPGGAVDYPAVFEFKFGLLEKAWGRFSAGARQDLHDALEEYKEEQRRWLPDYALFRGLKAKFDEVHYLDWPQELVDRRPAAMERARRELGDQIDRIYFSQFIICRQAERLKAYARGKGVRLIGDMPFFVSADSCDVWANSELFLLNEKGRPEFVAGVPPDYFSADGQLWGNPLYNWDALKETGYRWWIERLRALLKHADVIRLDHFRAFAAAWNVPVEATTARSGAWVPGPGDDFFRAVQGAIGSLPFIAEDLGMITPDVYALRDKFHLPGMRVLQFAFDGERDNPYLPENYVPNAVVYTGTHDNPTTCEWFGELAEGEQGKIRAYQKRSGCAREEPSRALMELGWSSAAALAIAPLQDVLNLGREARMNVPGQPEGNWRWRCTEEMLDDPALEWLRELTSEANRAAREGATSERATLRAASSQ
jgi:4-alpha-glucanotransferase